MKKRSNAFTLAEVLITLSIIGVVSALTMPSLMSNVRTQQSKAIVKRELSALNQAVRLNYANHDWDFSSLANDASGNDDDMKLKPGTNRSAVAMLNEALTGYTYLGALVNSDSESLSSDKYGLSSATTNYEGGIGSTEWYVAYNLSDNAVLAITKHSDGECSKSKLTEASANDLYNNAYQLGCIGFIDVNGAAPPNKQIKCKDGTVSLLSSENDRCEVADNAKGDIFPFIFYDSTAVLSTDAAVSYINK